MVKDLRIEDFTYDLPESKIALHPLEKRDGSKLLQYKSERITDHNFTDISNLLPESVGLFMHNSKVIYARLNFFKATGARIEIFCLEPSDTDPGSAMTYTQSGKWNCLIGNKKRWKGEVLELQLENDVVLKAKLLESAENNVVQFEWNGNLTFAEILEKAGKVPLPPYLNREAEANDYDRYQTVYSKIQGSVAAPTAGLHFTDNVLDSLRKRNISISEFTLHVGAGTFRPVKSDTIGEHDMHQEYAEVSTEALEHLLHLVKAQRPIICVGTTTLRTVESLFWVGIRCLTNKSIDVQQWDPYELRAHFNKQEILEALIDFSLKTNNKLYFKTGIIIAPGYPFQFMNGLITNFHQPNSTLLLLVSAIIGENWKAVYNHALENDYRFLSYGDSSLRWLS